MKTITWPLVIIVSSIGAGLVVAGNVIVPIRSMVIFWFLLICPGMAFIGLLQLSNHITELTLGIALSLALNTTLAEIMVLARIWSPNGGLIVAIGLSLLGALLQIRQAAQQTHTRPSKESRPAL